MALLKERGDSFALSMSLAEMAFLIIFVLLLLTTLSRTEEPGVTPLGGPPEPIPDPGPSGGGPNPPPDPTQPIVTDGDPPSEPVGGGVTGLGVPGEPPEPGVPPQTEGVGPPPCWTDADGNIEYLYNVVIHEDRYDIEKAWPRSRDTQAAEFDAESVVETGIELNAFKEGAVLIREWSDAQTPPCRHYFYVHVQDVDDLLLLLEAEDFMYKYIDRSPR